MHIDDEDRRNKPRSPVLTNILLVQGSRPVGEAKMINISATGLCATSHVHPRVGDTLSLAIGGLGQCDVEVIWLDGAMFGANFITPINPDLIDVTDREILSHTLNEQQGHEEGRWV